MIALRFFNFEFMPTLRVQIGKQGIFLGFIWNSSVRIQVEASSIVRSASAVHLVISMNLTQTPGQN